MTEYLLSKFGNPVKTQRIITNSDGTQMFVSYETIIAEKRPTEDGGEQVVLHTGWESSATTTYYRNKWLGFNTAETRKKIKSGEFLVEDLNPRGHGW